MRRQTDTKKREKKPAMSQSKATTTPLVRNIFDSMFKGQIDEKGGQGPRRKRCGICEV